MIQVDHLTRRFTVSRGEVVAVDDLSFRVGAGEVYGLSPPTFALG